MLTEAALRKLIREESELHAARLTTRIAGIIKVNLSKATHPEAIKALQQVQSQVEMFSLVFAPAAKDHPLTRSETPVSMPREPQQLPAREERPTYHRDRPDREEMAAVQASKLQRTPKPAKEPKAAKPSFKDAIVALHREQPTLTRQQLADQVGCCLALVHQTAAKAQLDIPRPTKAKTPKPERQPRTPKPLKEPKVRQPTLADKIEAMHRENPKLKRQQLADRVGCSLALVHQTFAKRQLKVEKVANVVRYLPPVKPRDPATAPILVKRPEPTPAPVLERVSPPPAKPVYSPKPQETVTEKPERSLATALFVYTKDEERIIEAHHRAPHLTQTQLARHLNLSANIVAYTFRKAKSIRDPRLATA